MLMLLLLLSIKSNTIIFGAGNANNMDYLFRSFKIAINEKLYLKDPESSDLGKRIVQESIPMIARIGFEAFTFRKLGAQIASNESSIYRYFENKHKLLLYLASWYWSWIEYQLVMATNSMSDPTDKLVRALEIMTMKVEQDLAFSHIDEVLLNRIVINEYSKSYLTKEVDKENKEGYYMIYKRLVGRIAAMIAEVAPSYPYPSSLASTVVDGALHQYFLCEHFPSMTDCTNEKTPTAYFTHLVLNTLNQKTDG